MLDLFEALHRFDLRVHDAQAMLEVRRQVAAGQVAVLVDRAGQDSAAM
jgi:hypothetical protein